ncbi:MAG: hypothetical protein R6V36_02365 [Psychroflexus sp.]
MKHFYLIVLIFLFASCQDEELFEQVENSTTLSSQSELSKLIARLTQNPTAFDDFIDNSNSLSLEFPFEVTVNSETTFSLTQFSDYQPLIDELSSQTEDYTITINYPVDVSLPNYELVPIQNQAEFDAVNASVEGSSEINCLEYNYPLNVNIFDADNAVTIRKTVGNRAQLFNLIQNLRQNNSFYQIVYPINISVNGNIQSISSNLDLNSAIENLPTECFNPTLLNNNNFSRLQQFITFITSGQFIIINFVDDGNNETLIYEDYRFTFDTNNTILAENIINGNTFTGVWFAEIDEDEFIFDIDFQESDILDELDEDWLIEAFANPNKIELLDKDDDTGEESLLIFEKI